MWSGVGVAANTLSMFSQTTYKTWPSALVSPYSPSQYKFVVVTILGTLLHIWRDA
jgi:hypothetical protein